MYVYIRSEPGLWTVGFYTPDGDWESESDHDSKESAAERVAWLNGSGPSIPHPEYNVHFTKAVSNIHLEDLKLDAEYPIVPKIDF